MSIMVDWMDSQYKLIHANFIDHWGWGDVSLALTYAHRLKSKSTKDVTLILDFVGSSKTTNSPALATIIKPAEPANKLSRLIIVTEEAPLAAELGQALEILYPELEEILIVNGHIQALALYSESKPSILNSS